MLVLWGEEGEEGYEWDTVMFTIIVYISNILKIPFRVYYIVLLLRLSVWIRWVYGRTRLPGLERNVPGTVEVSGWQRWVVECGWSSLRHGCIWPAIESINHSQIIGRMVIRELVALRSSANRPVDGYITIIESGSLTGDGMPQLPCKCPCHLAMC